MGWQDDPEVPAAPQAAPAPGATPAGMPQPAWMSDPVINDHPDTLRATAPDSVMPATGIPAVDAFNHFTEQANRAATFGLADKIAGLVPALNMEIGKGINAASNAVGVGTPFPSVEGQNFSDVYHQGLQASRDAGNAYAAENPWTSRAATALGTVGSLGTAQGAAALPTLGARILQGIKAGATAGGLSGFGNANDESVGKDLAATGAGAAAGAVVGGAVPVIADKVISPVWNAFTRSPLWQKLGGTSGVEQQAVDKIAQRIGQSSKGGGPSATDILDLLNAAGNKPMTIADVAGPDVQSMVGGMMRKPGAAQQFGTDFLNNRDLGAGTRLMGDVDQAVSNGGSAYSAAKALADAQKTAADPLYAAAFDANNAIQSPAIDEVLKTPAGQKALAQAAVKMRNDMAPVGGRAAQPQGALLDAEGAPIVQPAVPANYPLRTLDYAKQALDDQIGSALTAGNRGDARILIGLKNKLVDALDAADATAQNGQPGLYAQARAAYSGPAQSQKAIEMGQAINSKTSPEQIADEIADLSPGDRELYKLGRADTLRTTLASTGPAGDEANRIIGTDFARQQLRPLFPDDASYDHFISAVKNENAMFQTRYNLIGNSKTAGRVAEDAAQGGEGGSGVIAPVVMGGAATLGGEPFVGIPMMARGFGRALRTLGADSPAVNEAATRMLLTPGNVANRATLAQVLAAQQAPSPTVANSSRLAAALATKYPQLMALPWPTRPAGQ